MLAVPYTITLKGGMIAYILSLLAREQVALLAIAEAQGADMMADMSAQANDIVGDTLLHEAYRSAGVEFLTFVLGENTEEVERVMSNLSTGEEPKPATDCIGKNRRVLN